MSILITGANGQVGSELVSALSEGFGAKHVVASDLQDGPDRNGAVVYEQLDVRDASALRRIVEGYDVGVVYHLASLLSVTGEQDPDRAWEVNMDGLKHVLDLARQRDMQVFWPSSIAVFGPATPKERAPQDTILDPRTIYGITKVSGELLCRYYFERYGVDVRSLRYPGLISHTAPPGGGTTDYAVEIFHAATAGSDYECFVGPETRLPMMYMPDAVRAALELMDVPNGRINVRTSYNVGALSFTADEIAQAIRRRVPDFEVRFRPDRRQQIADSWPQSVDDSRAREEWGWRHEYDLIALVDDMLEHLSEGTYTKEVS